MAASAPARLERIAFRTSRLLGVGGRDNTFRYRRIAEEDENGIPYVVEAAFVARPHHAARAEAESPSGNKRRGHACRTNGITIPCVIPRMAVQRDFWEA